MLQWLLLVTNTVPSYGMRVVIKAKFIVTCIIANQRLNLTDSGWLMD